MGLAGSASEAIISVGTGRRLHTVIKHGRLHGVGALAGLDVGTSFGGIGSSREVYDLSSDPDTTTEHRLA
jgi:hypothetical protein